MSPNQFIETRANELFQERQLNRYELTDRAFQTLLVIQWFAAILFSFVVSPNTWIGETSSVHFHNWLAIFGGGLLTIVPCWFARNYAGHAITRHMIAISQMVWSALLIHLTGGRIETHFHVFGSLAFLAYYRDWKVLATATLVVALDHAIRGIF